ncbi:MAG: STAS domain-containing protein [Cyclobacteriaceae bacterium]
MVEITTTSEDGIYKIGVNGDVDASSSIHLDNALKEAIEKDESKILVDCRELNYISSAGLGVFMSYLEDLKEKNVSFAIYGLQEKVNHVFELIGLENLIKIMKTEEEAVSYLNGTYA